MPQNNQQVLFNACTSDVFASISTKDQDALYYITDTHQIFVGDKEYTKSVENLNAAPTASTEGDKGRIYLYDQNLYVCGGQNGSTYIWKEVAGGGSGADVTPIAVEDYDILTPEEKLNGDLYIVEGKPARIFDSLLIFDNTIVDETESRTGVAWHTSSGEAAVYSSEVSKFSEMDSIYFNGSYYLEADEDYPQFNLGYDSFTIEFFFYPTNVNSGSIFGYSAEYTFFINMNSGKMAFHLSQSDWNWAIDNAPGTLSITPNTWHHYAIVYDAYENYFTCYLDGKQDFRRSLTLTSSFPVRHPSGSKFQIGHQFNTTGFTGYMAEFAVRKGIAAYSGDFNPPATPFVDGEPAVPNTIYYMNEQYGLALGEDSGTAYRGDRGKIAYDDSQTNKANIGTMSELETTEKSSLVGAINELKGYAGTIAEEISAANYEALPSTDKNNGSIYMVDGGEVPAQGFLSLLHFEGDTVTDSVNGKAWTLGTGVSISTEQSKFGTKSVKFTGQHGGGVIASESYSDLKFGSSDFTVDGWIYPLSDASRQSFFAYNSDCRVGVDLFLGPKSANQWFSTNGGSWNIVQSDNASGTTGQGTITITANTWTHVALVRSGSRFITFINGQIACENNVGTNVIYNASDDLFRYGLWGWASNDFPFNGYMDELCIRNYAAWTEAFTPPTEPYGSTVIVPNAIYYMSTKYGSVDSSAFADDVSYDNTTSGLDATNVQDAIDEIATDAEANTDNIGDMSTLQTSDKSSLVAAINEIQGASGGASVSTMTAYDYNALTTQEKENGDVYVVEGEPAATFDSLLNFNDSIVDLTAQKTGVEWEFAGSGTYAYSDQVTKFSGLKSLNLMNKTLDAKGSYSSFNFGAGDFTMECFFYLNDYDGTFNTTFAGTTDCAGVAMRVESGGNFVISIGNGSSWHKNRAACLHTVTRNAWHHYAVVRHGTSIKAYLDGEVDYDSTLLATDSVGYGSGKMRLGGWYTGSPLNGYLAEFAVRKGVAAYTQPFTPPTNPYTGDTEGSSNSIYYMNSKYAEYPSNITASSITYDDTSTGLLVNNVQDAVAIVATEAASNILSIGDMSELETAEKSSLVAAINEVNAIASGGSSGGERYVRRDITSNLANLSLAISEMDLAKYDYAIGDYFTGASGQTYILADRNTYYGTGYQSYTLTTNHLGIVVLGTATSTKGGGGSYTSSTLYTKLNQDVLDNVKSDFVALFGDWNTHLLSRTATFASALESTTSVANSYITALTQAHLGLSGSIQVNYYQLGSDLKALELFQKYKFTAIFKGGVYLREYIDANTSPVAGITGDIGRAANDGGQWLTGLIAIK